MSSMNEWVDIKVTHAYPLTWGNNKLLTHLTWVYNIKTFPLHVIEFFKCKTLF